MADGIRTRLDGFDAARGVLGRMVARAENLAPALDSIGASLVVSIQARFERETGPEGGVWPPLSPRTLKRRGAGAKALRQSGRLFQSITHQVQGNTVVVGTNVVYARIHQFGGEIEQHARSQPARWITRGKNKGRFAPRGGRAGWVTLGAQKIRIPARPFVGIDRDDEAMAGTTILDHLRGGS